MPNLNEVRQRAQEILARNINYYLNRALEIASWHLITLLVTSIVFITPSGILDPVCNTLPVKLDSKQVTCVDVLCQYGLMWDKVKNCQQNFKDNGHEEQTTTTIPPPTEEPFPSSTTPKPRTYADLKNDHRREYVQQMMVNAWQGSVRHAWTYEALSSGTSFWSGQHLHGKRGSGATILAAMPTLWIMGIQVEFERGQAWIEKQLVWEKMDFDISIYDLVENYLGSLLACYALTGKSIFHEKALELAEKLWPAYKDGKGQSFEYINLKTGGLSGERESKLARIVAQQFEYTYLSNITGDQISFGWRSEKIYNFLQNAKTIMGNKLLLPTVEAGHGIGKFFSKLIDSAEPRPVLLDGDYDVYSILHKLHIQSGEQHKLYINLHEKMLTQQWSNQEIWPNNQSNHCVPDFYRGKAYDSANEPLVTMSLSSCNVLAFLQFGTVPKATLKNRYKLRQIEKLIRTCQLMTKGSKTGLPQELFYCKDKAGKTVPKKSLSLYRDIGKIPIKPPAWRLSYSNYSLLRPELAESYFILWRLTHDQIYRDWAWQLAHAIHVHAQIPETGGYACVKNVDQKPSKKLYYQPPYFLSATLKYLYLTFMDDSVLPLDKWVFNSYGHPLPICSNCSTRWNSASYEAFERAFIA